jgi:hypothetical protein
MSTDLIVALTNVAVAVVTGVLIIVTVVVEHSHQRADQKAEEAEDDRLEKVAELAIKKDRDAPKA